MTKRFGDVVAVDAVSFTIAKGTLVSLLGPSGCGKTTTLRMIAGLELPTEGQVFIGGEDVSRRSATDRDVAMVFQSYALFPHMTVADNVGFGLRIAGQSKPQARAGAEAGLVVVGLEGYGDRLPSALSGGQQQRVALARALVLEPEVLLFDEPLSNLDAKLRRKMRTDIRELQQELGFSAVYVTHDQEEAMSVSDTIIVMDHSVIVQEGPPKALYDAPVSEFVASFVGDANILAAQIVATGETHATVKVDALELALPHRGHAVGPAKLAVRPRCVHLAARPVDAGAGLAGTVRSATYLGSHMEYTVHSAAGDLFVIAGFDRTFEPGDAVDIQLADRGVVLVV